MSASSHRKVPNRASLPRRTTRDPLEEDEDPLSATLSPTSPQSGSASAGLSPLVRSQELVSPASQLESKLTLLDDYQDQPEQLGLPQTKNLSFLLDRSTFHPLSQVDVPIPFRRPFPGIPPPGSTSAQLIAQIDTLITKCDFLGAAHLAAICLTSGLIQPTDHATIFRLLAVRYSCLELMGQTILAAQEAKALEDLSSDFYYIIREVPEAELEAHGGIRPIPQHIMPVSLRVQAIRLQNIGFSDPRRGITMLYDLGLEIRENLTSKYTSDADRPVWTKRLESLNMHVVNALIELGDIDCAQRTLIQSKPTDAGAVKDWSHRMVLMYVKLGQLAKSQQVIDQLAAGDTEKPLLSSVVAVANGNYDEAVKLLRSAPDEILTSELGAVLRQNLAVALLYVGQIAEAQSLLRRLIEEGQVFPPLTVNLSTIFDLTSDKSRDQKLALVNKIAQSQPQRRPFTNADFKL